MHTMEMKTYCMFVSLCVRVYSFIHLQVHVGLKQIFKKCTSSLCVCNLTKLLPSRELITTAGTVGQLRDKERIASCNIHKHKHFSLHQKASLCTRVCVCVCVCCSDLHLFSVLTHCGFHQLRPNFRLSDTTGTFRRRKTVKSCYRTEKLDTYFLVVAQ